LGPDQDANNERDHDCDHYGKFLSHLHPPWIDPVVPDHQAAIDLSQALQAFCSPM
jgi:hypothetical protein